MPQQISTLLVEDDLGQAELIQHWLANEFPGSTVHHVETLANALQCSAHQNFDVLLLDLDLSDSQEHNTIRSVYRLAAQVPIVALVGQDNEMLAIEALEEGVHYYLIKNHLTADKLARVIRHAIKRQRKDVANQYDSTEIQANQQLREENEQLARANQNARQFVDNVSHDFRTPLTVIKEFVAIMRDGLVGQVNAQQQEYLDTISGRVDDLTTMIDDLLDASKLEGSMLSSWRREAAFSEMVAQAARMLQRKAALKNIRLEIEIPSDLPNVFCDGEKICRVLTNLTGNSIKFSPEGKTVRIGARHLADQAEVLVQIADEGPGISLENQARIFQRFQQCEETSLENNQGCGLGLSIAHELVRMNFGNLTVASELGRGSTFSFTLPVADVQQIMNRLLRQLRQSKGGTSWLSTFAVRLKSHAKVDASTIVDEFLQHTLRSSDLVLSTTKCAWLVLAGCPGNDLDALIHRLQANWQQQSRACPGRQLPELYFEKGPIYEVAEQDIDLVPRLMEQYRRLQQSRFAATKLLLVDDDRDIVRGLSVRLRATGYEVTTAHDGASGYEAALKTRPDAMILDMRMPGMNGLAVLSQLRQRPETRDIPVIVLSASLRDQQLALEMGARYFLDKPCDPQTLLTALHSVAAPPVA
ncbi:MAG TPA: response regulator [Pirellulales bacterium]|jgi:hypothetical protein|nr:response regulator [Pirellulales bacterium]